MKKTKPQMNPAPLALTALSVAALVLLGALPAAAAPPALPATFFGVVTDLQAWERAPVGLEVTARIDQQTMATTRTFDSGGQAVYRIDISGDDPDTAPKEGGTPGSMVVFVIGGNEFPAAPWQSGITVRFDIALREADADEEPPPSAGSGGFMPATAPITPPAAVTPPPAPPPPMLMALTLNILSITVPAFIDAAGKVQQAITVDAQESGVRLMMAKDTLAVDKDGLPITSLSAQPADEIPPLPEGMLLAGPILQMQPEGATFSPPIIVVVTYRPAELPPGVDEKACSSPTRTARNGQGLAALLIRRRKR